jgi:metal-responsive CopG/Arc/MetJ family transcriptional regulator
MLSVKTAISLEKTLFDQAETAARAMKVSRSRLFALALQDFFERQKNKELLAQINTAWDDEPDTSEKTLRQKSRRQHRRLVEGEW